MSSNIPSKPAYGVYVSQLVRIGRICSCYENAALHFSDTELRSTGMGVAIFRACVIPRMRRKISAMLRGAQSVKPYFAPARLHRYNP